MIPHVFYIEIARELHTVLECHGSVCWEQSLPSFSAPGRITLVTMPWGPSGYLPSLVRSSGTYISPTPHPTYTNDNLFSSYFAGPLNDQRMMFLSRHNRVWRESEFRPWSFLPTGLIKSDWPLIGMGLVGFGLSVKRP